MRMRYTSRRGTHDETGEGMQPTRGDNELIQRYENNWESLYAEDDVSGTALNPKFVIQARRIELDFFRKMKVYTKVPRRSAKTSGKISSKPDGLI